MAETTGRLHLIPGESCASGTAQTSGMQRFAAISGAAVGSQSIWMGRTHVAPGASSGPHHHGHSETGIYVVSGHPLFICQEDGQEIRLQTKPGDFVFVPPFVPHIEANPSPDEEAVVVLARSTQEAIVENLEHL